MPKGVLIVMKSLDQLRRALLDALELVGQGGMEDHPSVGRLQEVAEKYRWVTIALKV